MTRWISKANWQRSKGSVSKQLQDKAGPKVRLGREIVKRGSKLALGAERRRPGHNCKRGHP